MSPRPGTWASPRGDLVDEGRGVRRLEVEAQCRFVVTAALLGGDGGGPR